MLIPLYDTKRKVLCRPKQSAGEKSRYVDQRNNGLLKTNEGRAVYTEPGRTQ